MFQKQAALGLAHLIHSHSLPHTGVSHGNIMVYAVNARAQAASEGGQGEPALPKINLDYHLRASVMDYDVLGANCISSPMGSWHTRKYSA